MLGIPVVSKLRFATILTIAACSACGTVPPPIAPSLEARVRWHIGESGWFVRVIPAHRATFGDAKRIILALRQGLYEDHTPNPEYSRKVLASLVLGQVVTFATYNDTDHSLAWSSSTQGALAEVGLSGDVVHLQSALFFVDSRSAG
jgi:hypothetical protein